MLIIQLMSACNVIYIQIFKNGDGKHLDFSDRHHLFQYRFSVVPLGMSTLPTDGGQPWSKRGGRQERGISDWRFPYRRHLSGFRKLSDCLTVSGFKKKKSLQKLWDWLKSSCLLSCQGCFSYPFLKTRHLWRWGIFHPSAVNVNLLA